MNLVQGDIITLSGEEFLILDSMLYGGIEYAFGNKITKNEEPTKEYFVFKVEDNGESVERITEKAELDIVLPMFSKNVQKMIDEAFGN